MIGKTPTIELLTRVLDAAHIRHAVIAHNLANVNTPNFKRLEVPFALESATKTGGLVTQAVPIVQAEEGRTRVDGNSVDIDAEISLLHRNSLLAAATTQILAQQLAQLRSAIVGR
jgi:flagellar basal-body rod protein FlgB